MARFGALTAGRDCHEVIKTNFTSTNIVIQDGCLVCFQQRIQLVTVTRVAQWLSLCGVFCLKLGVLDNDWTANRIRFLDLSGPKSNDWPADQRNNQDSQGSDSYGMKDVKSEVIRRKERCWRFQEWPFCGPQLSWFLWLVDSRSCSFQSSPYYATQRSSGCFERFRNCDDTVQVWIVTTRIVMSFCLVQGKTHFHSRTGHQSQQAMWGRNDLFAVEVPVRLILPGFCVSTRFHCSASNAKQTCLFCTWPSFSDAVESHIFWIRVTENFSLYAQSSNCTSSCHKNILYTVVTYT